MSLKNFSANQRELRNPKYVINSVFSVFEAHHTDWLKPNSEWVLTDWTQAMIAFLEKTAEKVSDLLNLIGLSDRRIRVLSQDEKRIYFRICARMIA